MALFVPVFLLADPSNTLLNPDEMFSTIFNGAGTEEIWKLSAAGGFPGAHCSLQYIGKSDSWAMPAINLGCSVGLWGLLPAIAIQILRERNWLDAILGLALAALICLSMLGVISIAA